MFLVFCCSVSKVNLIHSTVILGNLLLIVYFILFYTVKTGFLVYQRSKILRIILLFKNQFEPTSANFFPLIDISICLNI